MTPPKQRYIFLDGLRGIAAIAVMLGHVQLWLLPGGSLAHFEFAVDFFFVLSGFVIAHAFGEQLANSQPGRIREFMRLRVVRLYPLLFLASVVGIVAILPTIATKPGANPLSIAVASALNTAGLPGLALDAPFPTYFPVNFPVWSLFDELLVNLLFAVAAPFFFKKRNLLAAVAISAVAFVVFAKMLGMTAPGPDVRTFFHGFARVAFGFLMGVLLSRIKPNVSLHPVWALVITGMLCALLFIPLHLGFKLRLAIVLFVLPAMVYLAAMTHLPSGVGKFSSWLGNVSYPLYLLHVPVAWWVSERILKPLDLGQGWLVTERIVVWFLCIASAHLAFRFYDAPARKWLNNATLSLGRGLRRLPAHVD